jgi:hypothetical protein
MYRCIRCTRSDLEVLGGESLQVVLIFLIFRSSGVDHENKAEDQVGSIGGLAEWNGGDHAVPAGTRDVMSDASLLWDMRHVNFLPRESTARVHGNSRFLHPISLFANCGDLRVLADIRVRPQWLPEPTALGAIGVF